MTNETTAQLRTVVTDSLISMIAAVTGTVPPADTPPPPFIQGPIDRAMERISAAIAQQAAPVAVPNELRAKAEKFVISRRQAAEFDRVAESELEDEGADEAQACAVQAFFHEEAAALVEQLLAAAPTPPAQSQFVPIHQVMYLLSGNTDWQDSDSARKEWCETENAKNAAEGRQIRWETRTLYRQLTQGDTAAPEQQSQWVPVSERLPEIDTPVFLYEPNFGIWIGGCADADDGWMWAHAQGTQWFADGKWKADLFIDEDYKPSHWIPLPAAPGGTAAPERAEQDAVKVPRELLGRITRNGGVDTLLAIDELRALLGGDA